MFFYVVFCQIYHFHHLCSNELAHMEMISTIVYQLTKGLSPEEIKALNEIAWWDWSDKKISENYDDLYLLADEFIKRHLK